MNAAGGRVLSPVSCLKDRKRTRRSVDLPLRIKAERDYAKKEKMAQLFPSSSAEIISPLFFVVFLAPRPPLVINDGANDSIRGEKREPRGLQ